MDKKKLLDQMDHETARSSRVHDLLPLVPSLIIGALAVITVFSGYYISWQKWAGIICAPLLITVFFLARKAYSYLLIIVLIAGVFNVVSFTPVDHFFQMGFGSIMIRFHLVSLGIAILAYILYRARHRLKEEKPEPLPSHLAEMEERNRREEIEKFRIIYSGYSSERLENIVEEKKYVPAALEAARQILEERKHQGTG